MLRDLEVEIDPSTTVILGENNTGKSAFLAALDVAFRGTRPTVDDLFRSPNQSSDRFRIDVQFMPSSGLNFDADVKNVFGDAIEIPKDVAVAESFAIRLEASRDTTDGDLATRAFFLSGWAATALERPNPRVSSDVRKRLTFDLLDAQRDVVAQLRNRRTTWANVASLTDVSSADRMGFETELADLSMRVGQGSRLLRTVRTDLGDLGRTLGAGTLEINVNTLPRRLDDLTRTMDITVRSTESEAFGASSQGMGTRSLAALLVFRSAVNGASMTEGIAASGAARLSAFEEPEAHLHPQAQRSVFDCISEISGQNIITTHSTAIIATANVQALRTFRRKGPSANVASASGFPADKLADVKRLFLQRSPHALFARAVGLVEGDSDHNLMQRLAHRWWPEGPDSVGVSILSCDGVDKVVHFAPLLSSLGVPWIFMRDGDAEGAKAEEALRQWLTEIVPANSEVRVLCLDGDIEQTLLSVGEARVDTVLSQHECGPLQTYIDNFDGAKKRKNEIRDYKGDAGRTRARSDLIRHSKMETASLFAAHLTALPPDQWPERFREFFRCLDELAGRPARTE